MYSICLMVYSSICTNLNQKHYKFILKLATAEPTWNLLSSSSLSAENVNKNHYINHVTQHNVHYKHLTSYIKKKKQAKSHKYGMQYLIHFSECFKVHKFKTINYQDT